MCTAHHQHLGHRLTRGRLTDRIESGQRAERSRGRPDRRLHTGPTGRPFTVGVPTSQSTTLRDRRTHQTTQNNQRESISEFEKQTDKPDTATQQDATGRETHPTGHTEGGTNGPPEPRQTHGSTIYLSLTGHSGGLPLGTTDCKRPAAGEELPHHHCAPGHGIWLGRTSAVGVKSSCMQIWVPTGFRSFAAVANPTQSARQAVMNAVPCLLTRAQCTRSSLDLRVLISKRTISYSSIKPKLLLLGRGRTRALGSKSSLTRDAPPHKQTHICRSTASCATCWRRW